MYIQSKYGVCILMRCWTVNKHTIPYIAPLLNISKDNSGRRVQDSELWLYILFNSQMHTSTGFERYNSNCLFWNTSLEFKVRRQWLSNTFLPGSQIYILLNTVIIIINILHAPVDVIVFINTFLKHFCFYFSVLFF